MEPIDLNAPQPDEEKWLKQIFLEEHPLPDNDFSSRVVKALPPRSKNLWLTLDGTELLAGLAFAVAVSSVYSGEIKAWVYSFGSFLSSIVTPLANPTTCITVGFCIFAVLFAVSPVSAIDE